MPKFRAIVEGQNFLFMVEHEAQHLDFHRTLCFEADCIDTARQRALGHVMAELSAQQIWHQENNIKQKINLEHIEQVDVLESNCSEQDFIWYFPDDALFEHTLRAL